MERSAAARDILDNVKGDLIRVYPSDTFCADKKRCVTHSTEKLYYYDDDHLSTHGAKLVVADLFKKLDSASKSPDMN